MADDMDDHASVIDESGVNTTMASMAASSNKKANNGVKSFMTYEQRLASFSQVVSRKRPSSAKGSSKMMKLEWPAENPAPEKMAEAGFYYKPTVKGPDNVACFLCQKQLDGWEPTDNPKEEHRVHSPECGWAICRCTAYSSRDDPSSEEMVIARMMTFAKWWPHETKKGWRPKIENLALAGFMYAPKAEADDRVICQYCDLDVHGWEPKDSPRDFHQENRPNCAIFTFGVEKVVKKAAASENVEPVNLTADEQESAPVKVKPKKRASKAATGTKKKGVKKAAAIQSEEEHEDYQDLVFRDGAMETDNEEAVKPTSKKAAKRGTKRKSSAMESEDEQTNKPLYNQKSLNAKVLERQLQHLQDVEEAKASPVKRRMTRASLAAKDSRFSLNVSVPAHLAQSSEDESLQSFKNTPAKNKKVRGGSRQVSATSTKSRTSTRKASATAPAPMIVAGMDDDEIDRALELDLQRPLSDEEDGGAKLNAELENFQSPIASPVPSEQPSPEQTKSKGRRRLTRTKPVSRDSELSEIEIPMQTKPNRRLTRTKPQPRIIETDDEQEVVPRKGSRRLTKTKPPTKKAAETDDEEESATTTGRQPTYATGNRRASRAAEAAPVEPASSKPRKGGKKGMRTSKQVAASPPVSSDHEVVEGEGDEESVPATPPRAEQEDMSENADEDQEEIVQDTINVQPSPSPTTKQRLEEDIEDSIVVSPISARAPQGPPSEVTAPDVPADNDAAMEEPPVEIPEEVKEKPKKGAKKGGKKGTKSSKAAAKVEPPVVKYVEEEQLPQEPDPEPVPETAAEIEAEVEVQAASPPKVKPEPEPEAEAIEIIEKPKKASKRGRKPSKANDKDHSFVDQVIEEQQPQPSEKAEVVEEEPKKAAKKGHKAKKASIKYEVLAEAEEEFQPQEEEVPEVPEVPEVQEPEKVEQIEEKPKKAGRKPSKAAKVAPTVAAPEVKETKAKRGRPSKSKSLGKRSLASTEEPQPGRKSHVRQSLKRKSSQEIVSPKSPKLARTRMMAFDIEISPLKDSGIEAADPADISDLHVSELQALENQSSEFQVSDLRQDELNNDLDSVEITGEVTEQKEVSTQEDNVQVSEPEMPTPLPKRPRGRPKSIRSARGSEGNDTTIDSVLHGSSKSNKEAAGKTKRASTQSKRSSSQKASKAEQQQSVREDSMPSPPSSSRKEEVSSFQASQVSQASSSPYSVLNTQFTDVSGRETQLTQVTESALPSPKKGVSFAEQVEIDQQLQSELELSFQAEQSRLSGEGYDEGESYVSSAFEENVGGINETSQRTPLSTSRNNRNVKNNNIVVLATPSRQQLVLRDDGKALVSTKPYNTMTIDSLDQFQQDENRAPMVSSLIQDERKMTVSQWIKANALQSEKRVLQVCENVVAAFEEQGRRAVASVEGIQVNDY